MEDIEKIPERGLTRAISIIYFLYGFGFFIAAISGVEVAGTQLYWKYDIWIPLLIMVISIGTIRLTIWGRWLSYLLSAFFFLGVPIGTFFGGYMIWQLTKYRSSFNQWF